MIETGLVFLNNIIFVILEGGLNFGGRVEYSLE
jgi:hypothetical protein